MNKKIKPYDYVIGFDKSFGFIHHIPSKRIVKCKTELAKILKESLEKKQIDEQVEQFLFDTFEKKCNYSDCQKAEVVKKGLSRLEIIITTACNLNCSYCYADGGNYGRQRMTMSIETADRIISFIIKKGDQIGEIVFFGGEPLLGFKTIMYICDKLDMILLKRPQYKIVSNFTVLPNEFIQYIEKYDIIITISLDGPKEITNKLRVPRDGVSDTYEKVVKNIERLKERKLDVRCIECTFTEEHERTGYTKQDLVNFFENNFGEYDLYLCDEHKYAKRLREKEETKEVGELFGKSRARVLEGWYKRGVDTHFCNAGFSMIAVYPDGSIFPCHGFASSTQWETGNVYGSENENREKSLIVQKLLTEIKEKSDCKRCTAREGCLNCMSELVFEWNFKLEDNCKWKRHRNEKVLLEYCRNK